MPGYKVLPPAKSTLVYRSSLEQRQWQG
jgi:hypothetical protein